LTTGGGGGPKGLGGGGGGVAASEQTPLWDQKLFVQVIWTPYVDAVKPKLHWRVAVAPPNWTVYVPPTTCGTGVVQTPAGGGGGGPNGLTNGGGGGPKGLGGGGGGAAASEQTPPWDQTLFVQVIWTPSVDAVKPKLHWRVAVAPPNWTVYMPPTTCGTGVVQTPAGGGGGGPNGLTNGVGGGVVGPIGFVTGF
jgi:hypothetical protein